MNDQPPAPPELPEPMKAAALAAVAYRQALLVDIRNHGGQINPGDLHGFCHVLAQEVATLRGIVLASLAKGNVEQLEGLHEHYFAALTDCLNEQTDRILAAPKVMLAGVNGSP